MNYDALISTIAQVHQQAQAGAAGAVNRQLLLRNWLIGAHLVECEQNGEDRAQYGQELLPRLAKDLAAEDVPGCSREMLGRMRLLFRLYPQLEPVIRSSPMTESLVPLTALAPIRSSAMTDSRGLTPNLPGRVLSAELVLRLSWTHLIELVRIEDPWKRAFFEDECLRGNCCAGLDHQLFASRHLVALPKPDDLKRLVEVDLTHWQQSRARPTPS